MKANAAHGHQHGEAFMLMRYVCKNCGHDELIWNSRDGVTPFGVGCSKCDKGIANHIDWGWDAYVPNHRLRHKQRFFRDGTTDEAVKSMERRFEAMKDDYPLEPGEKEEMLSVIRKNESTEFLPGWPFIETFGE